MRNRHRVMAAGAILLAATVAAGFFAVNAHAADEVTETNIGKVSQPVYNNGNPANGHAVASAYGTKLDTVGDGDNDADKHRAEGRIVKISGVARVSVQAKLQRRIPGTGWVTAAASGIARSGNAGQSARAATPIIPFACGLNLYRSYVNDWSRHYVGNTFEADVVISRTWYAYGDCATA